MVNPASIQIIAASDATRLEVFLVTAR